MVQALRFLTDPRRAWVRLGLALLVALFCFVLAAWAWQRNRTWPERAVLPLQDPLANLNQVGVNADLTQYTPAELDAALAHIARGGFRWVRQRFPWDQIEPQQGAYDWAAWDALVTGCTGHDLRLIAVLDGTPSWARPNGEADPPLTPPAEVTDWGDFVAEVAVRYRGQVAAYQVWDEPNLAEHWGGLYVDPVAYTSLLREGAIRIRDVDPGAAILLAALAPTLETGPLNLNEVAFLSGVVGAGGRPYLDGVALQPYGFADSPASNPEPGRLNFSRAAYVRREMVRLGLGDCPVWATAWGWNALPASREWQAGPWPPGPWPAVDRERQAAYTIEALQMARREWPWMGPMIVYHYQPDRPPDDPRWGFALVDAEGESGLLYEELARYNAGTQPYGIGVYRPRPDNARYTGATAGDTWRFSEAGADPPRGADVSQRNAVLAFDVGGTALDLTVRRGNYWGVLYVAIDGRPANGLPRDEEGRSYLVLYDPSGRVETVHVARGLSAGAPHRVEIVAHGGWGQWPLAGWTVRRAQAPPPGGGALWLLLAGVGATAAALGQVVGSPVLHRPLYATLGRLFGRYRALPEWIPALATLCAALAVYWIPWTPAALLMFVAWTVLAFLRIDLGLATVAFCLPFYLRPVVLFGRPFSVIELSLAGCAAAWLAARLLDWGRRTKDKGRPLAWRLQEWSRAALAWLARPWRIPGWTALDVGMAAWVLVALLSVGGAAPGHAALREWRTVFLESALFYALIRLAARSPRARRRLIEGWLLGAALVAGIGIWQALAGRNLITAEGVWRVRGLYGSPNNLALYLERALPVLLAVAWRGFDARAGRACREWLWKAVYGGAALLVLAALLLTVSKGALLLGVPASLLALGLLQRDRRATWTVLGALSVLALFLAPLLLTERFGSLLDVTQGTGFFRLKLWRSAVNMIADHPLTGVGLDGFLYAYRSRYVLPSAWGDLNLSHPHNLLLDAWTRLGALGVVVLGWLLVSFFRAAWRAYHAPRGAATGYPRALLLGAMAAMVAVVGHGTVDQAVFTIDLAFVFGLLLATVQGEHGQAGPCGWRQDEPRF